MVSHLSNLAIARDFYRLEAKMAKKSQAGKSKQERAKADEFERVNGYLLNAVEDAPDFRDFIYQPALLQLSPEWDPPKEQERIVLDQGSEGACTGFGLAAVINLQLSRQNSPRRVSPRMLYEMAKKYDEWKGEDYSGSSCRGAIRGWYKRFRNERDAA